MSRAECTDSNTAQNPETSYWSHTHKCTPHVGENICVNQAATIPGALPAPPSPCAMICIKVHTHVEHVHVCVPVQSGESDTEINLTKKKNISIFKKSCRAIFKLYHFHNLAWAAPLPIPAAKQQRGQRPAARSWSPACTAGQREPGASEQLQPAQDRGFTAPVIPSVCCSSSLQLILDLTAWSMSLTGWTDWRQAHSSPCCIS